ncbi:SCO2400 family protein [Streptomyces sp. BR1]|uniref:SCO2400 family protein n=1 Tax=Streptomyces sp. BR1 TaxID=1592323 RepID=UPI00402B30A3
MDYCHVCRRHLNGALACAGCGTPAEELRQPDIIDLGVYDTAAAGATDAAPTGYRRARREREREQPRARTRRRARKRRGRLVLFGSAGVVLAAGALGLAELAIEPPANDRGAATSVHDEEQISQETSAPAPDASEGGPRRPSAVPASAGHGKSHAKGGGARPWPGASGVPVPGGTRAGRTGEPSAPGATSGATGGTRSPGPSGAPSPSASDSAPPPGQPGPAPSPTPSPTKTSCTRFLWWCV